MSQVVEPSLVDQARSALRAHAWQDAWNLLSEADRAGSLDAAGLELLADAAWWIGRLPAAIEARERAYAAAMKAHQPEAAVVAAIGLAREHLIRNSHTVATAWMQRADRLLAGSEENPAHGWLAATRAFQAALTGDLEHGVEQAVKAQEIGARFGDRDLEVLAMSCRGFNLLALGQVEAAMPLLDEATVAATAGELEPGTAGGVCCSTIEACAALGDWGRASEWTEAQDRWCVREGINGYPGMCRLFRAEVKRLRGAWVEAEAEARRASVELEGFMPAAIGVALYQIGELRLRYGDFDAAEQALRRAHVVGRDPEPALSLLRLAQGRIEEAQASIGRALDEPATEPSWAMPPNSGLSRASLLPARVEIALAAGDVGTARTASDELAVLAERYGSAAFKATAAVSEGAVRLAEGEPKAAVTALRDGIRLWSGLDAPYEVARGRLNLGRAWLSLGNRDGALLEIEAARSTFERLGATPDLTAADELLASLGADGRRSPAAANRTRRTFVFTDIVDSTRYAELVGDEAWVDMLRWHDGLVRSVVAEFEGEEIKGTGDGFFLSFPTADAGIAAAMAIQRRLVDQRQRQGFALAVRIGVHEAEANRVGRDYSGSGVNVAARIAAAASGAEILASATTVAAGRRPVREVERRTAELKGIATPVELVAVDWK